MKKIKKESLKKILKSALQFVHTMVDIVMPIVVFLYQVFKNDGK